VSTGNTSRHSEYIITQRATFNPTPGSAVKNTSHSWSDMRRSGANVILPKRFAISPQIFLTILDFVGDSPPGFSGLAISFALANPKSANRGNVRRRAAKVSRYLISSVCTLHRINSSS
jgi:hypothetical protein